ncbi:hypothetical protein Tco_1351865 [Tanacetum coccineum]
MDDNLIGIKKLFDRVLKTHNESQQIRASESQCKGMRKRSKMLCEAVDIRLVVTESSGTKPDKQDTSSSSENYTTQAVDSDIGPINDEEPLAEEFPEFCEFFVINDLKAQLLARTTLICDLKKQIKSVKEATNEQLHKENEHLKQTYKELFDSIKKSKVQNKDNSESLISQINQKFFENADLKAQLQEKVFANAALKNELRKIKGNSVDTKLAKASILGKPSLQPSRNHLVVRQPNAFKSRPRISRPWFASQVDEKNDLSKTVTPHYLPKVRESAAAKPHQWIPTGKVFIDSTTKVDSEPPNGSNDDITNPYECNQTLYVSAGTSNSSAVQASFFILMTFGQNSSSLVLHQMTLDHSSSSLGPHCLMMSIHISSGLVLHLEDVWINQFKPRSLMSNLLASVP